MVEYRSFLGPAAVALLIGAAVLWSPFEPHRSPGGGDGAEATMSAWLDEDWARFEAKVAWAMGQGLDTLPMGAAIAELGRSFVGTAYVPQTLEVDGPERVVINFRGLDCVTFVENAYAIARFVRSAAGDPPASRPAAEARYEAILSELRYRDGVVAGYPSRLHYFSDWIGDNHRRGLIADLGRDLGGIRDEEPIDFMTQHPDAYRQLADPTNVEAVRSVEARLSATGRTFVPESRIAEASSGIEDGDIIAATSTVAGLDVAHTGLALWVDGTLRLLHAPLVGDSVQISEVTLAERILRIEGQDGIMVARPLER